MTKLNHRRSFAGIVAIGAIVLAACGCTITVGGTATAAPVIIQSTEGETVKAPDEDYVYEDGTTVTLTGYDADPNMSGLISDEVGFTMKFTVKNESETALDFSSTASDTDVECPNGGTYVFPSNELGGPESLPAGDSADYTVDLALKPESFSTPCTVTFPFATESGPASSVASFEIAFDENGNDDE
ncbi:MAG: hypothetical protein ACK5MR_11430 [Cumulibacter sp.]